MDKTYCPDREFCYNSSDNVDSRYRMKPIKSILQEIESLGTRHVMFIDDNFIGNVERTRALLQELIPMNLTWHAAVSADIGRHQDVLDMMAQAGCKSLFIGFESINRENLKQCSKFQNQVRLYNETIEKIHRLGMMVNASLVFGFDHDNYSVFPNTLRWLEENNVETMTGHILTPYPGTAFYNRLKWERRIIDYDYRHYNTAYAVFRPRKMSKEELEHGYKWIYSQFYSWKSILKRRPSWHSGQMTAYLTFAFIYRKFGNATCELSKVFGMRNLAKLARFAAYPVRNRALESHQSVTSHDSPRSVTGYSTPGNQTQ